jgi:hypothetical protein
MLVYPMLPLTPFRDTIVVASRVVVFSSFRSHWHGRGIHPETLCGMQPAILSCTVSDSLSRHDHSPSPKPCRSLAVHVLPAV